MRILAEAKVHISKLLGQPRTEKHKQYRLMRYVLRVDYDDRVLLHNVVTGQLVVLESSEKELLEGLPCECTTGLVEQLVQQYYLVPVEHDEIQKVIGLQKLLRILDNKTNTSSITFYTILPTTACNARCYYCFEHGVNIQTMSKQTADDVIAFIKAHHDGKHVSLLWFGGEPTVASSRIDQICEGLKDNDISFESRMISNGYLFNKQMIERAVSLWNLKQIQITVDGAENNTNRIKDFLTTNTNPYQRVLGNVESFCNSGVYVDLRMNYDLDNSFDFVNLLEDVLKMRVDFKKLCVSSHPVTGEHFDRQGNLHHGTSEWFEDENCKHDMAAIRAGLLNRRRELPHLKYRTCMAASNYSIVIRPDGSLVRCAECIGDDQVIGDIIRREIDKQLYLEWKKTEYLSKCMLCVYFPVCVKVSNCPGKGNCTSLNRRLLRDHFTMKNVYEVSVSEELNCK